MGWTLTVHVLQCHMVMLLEHKCDSKVFVVALYFKPVTLLSN